MPQSPNKGYELQVTGTNTNTWGDVLNDDTISVIDENLGGTVSKTLSNAQVDLNATESQALRLILNGALTGNVLVTTLAVGMVIIDNQCTGNFTVTFQKNGVGTPVALPNGSTNLVTMGASGDPKTAGVDFPAGTRLAFQQTTPPTGWTKDTTTVGLNNSAMRLVTGSVVNGGSGDFTTVFASNRQPTGNVQAMTLDITQIPSHQHGYIQPINANSPTGSGATRIEATQAGLTDAIGGGQSHNHGLTLNTIDFAVRFFDFVIGVKQ